MARLAAVGVPGIGLVTTIAMVLVVSLGVLGLPERLRLGPRLGGGAVGGGILIVTAGIALTEAAHALAASTPFWSADLAGWSARVSAIAPYGWQVPVSLLLAAGAAWALLPKQVGGDIGFVTLCLGALAVPAVAGLPWWSPALIAGALAVVAGIGAALVGPTDPPGTHRRRSGLAVLGLYATAASGATSAATGIVLSGIVAAGVVVATLARLRRTVPASVAGIATAAALAAAPGAAAATAVAGGIGRTGVLASALAVAALGILVVAGLRLAGVEWGVSVFGVGIAALVVAGLRHLDPSAASVWAAAGALVATAAAALPDPSHSDRRVVTAALATTAVPAAILAAAVSASAWLTALVGPYRTLRQVWAGYAATPEPRGPATAMVTLLLLAGVCAGIALTLGGGRYVLAAILAPLAAACVVLPSAVGASREATPWVALAVALLTGLGAALSPPTLPSAATLLRGTAGIVCAVTGGAGMAGSLATRAATLAALGLVAAGGLVAALLGRDPAARTVAWIVSSTAGFALPPTALAADGRELRPAAFAVLALCGVLVAFAWWLARLATRRPDAAVVGSVRCWARPSRSCSPSDRLAHRRRADYLRSATRRSGAAPRHARPGAGTGWSGRARRRTGRVLDAALRHAGRTGGGVHAAVCGCGLARRSRGAAPPAQPGRLRARVGRWVPAQRRVDSGRRGSAVAVGQRFSDRRERRDRRIVARPPGPRGDRGGRRGGRGDRRDDLPDPR